VTTPRILGTLVYVLREGEGEPDVLMMHRNKEPNLGLWVAPGGKVDPDESPRESARRELLEETGLVAHDLFLRGIITELTPPPNQPWLLFAYLCREWEGTLQADRREGELEWVARSAIARLPRPQADTLFTDPVLDLSLPPFEATMIYDREWRLIEVRRF
jgi:ADP-ribose pyrophosphatase YjhB (NUDIX family)